MRSHSSIVLYREFAFGNENVRVVGTPEVPLFVARDVFRAIGVRCWPEASKRINSSDKVLAFVRTGLGNRNMLCITEAGLNSFVGRSTKSTAPAFIGWVQEVVLPTIRGASPNLDAIITQHLTRSKLLEEAGRWLSVVERARTEWSALGGIHRDEGVALCRQVSSVTNRLHRILASNADVRGSKAIRKARTVAEHLVECGIDSCHAKSVERFAARLFWARYLMQPDNSPRLVDGRFAYEALFWPIDLDLVEEAIALALPERPTPTAHQATDLVPSAAPKSKVSTSMEAIL
jgi:prophage antirepressor-like protein